MDTKVNKNPLNVSVSVFDGQVIVASAGMDFINNHWWLARLIVKRDFRKMGLGRQLVNKLKENADGYPIEVMPGGYDISREEQFAFYQKCGFVKVNKDALLLDTKG